MGTISYNGYAVTGIKKWTGSGGGGHWETGTIPVDLSTNTPVTLGRIVTDTLHTGDLLRITAWARVTNDVGYTVGVGYYLKGYEYTLPGVTNPYFPIETLNGQNVTPNGQTHHLPIHTQLLWEVPEAYDGKRVVLNFRADAHSTAWEAGDTLTIDQGYGQFWYEHLQPVV